MIKATNTHPAGFLAQLALIDLGSDAQAQDIDYHVGYLLSLDAAGFTAYLQALDLDFDTAELLGFDATLRS